MNEVSGVFGMLCPDLIILPTVFPVHLIFIHRVLGGLDSSFICLQHSDIFTQVPTPPGHSKYKRGQYASVSVSMLVSQCQCKSFSDPVNT